MWNKGQRALIRVFVVMFVTLALLMLVLDVLFLDRMDLSFWGLLLGVVSDLIFGYAFTSFILGLYFIWRFRGEGIVPLRRLLVTAARVALVVAFAFTLMVAVVNLHLDLSSATGWDLLDTSAALSVLVMVVLFMVIFMVVLLSQLVILVGGFGIMGVLYVLESGGTPWLLRTLEGITRREDVRARVIMWFFGIPGALDTDVVLVDEPVRETAFPWDRFRTAVLWQVAFGVILAIYVSLNPWLLRNYSMDELFQFMSTAFVALPLLVVPWFIHRRLDSRFKGVSRDFHLYKALRDRFTGLIIAGGTLFIFLRFAWERSSAEEILMAFSSYVVIMVLCIIVFTFVYFNFFENRLALRSYARWMEARAEAKVAGGDDGPDGDGAASSEEGS